MASLALADPMSTVAQPDPLQLVGTTIAEKYAVEGVVGEGGFAIVYRATHLLWKRPVALKVFRALGDFRDDQREKLLQEFLQEGALLAELSERSAAIVQARDVGEVALRNGEKAPYMVLEWLEGATLERVFYDEKRVGLPRRSVPEAVKLLEPAAEALALAHNKGIAHRDFKPGNVFVIGDARGECTVKLLDFGIAKVVQDAQKMGGAFSKTSGVITSFTPQYGAPEQFNRQYGATGPWTDVFALALVLVEAVGGVEGHQGDNLMQMAFAACDPQRRPTPRTLGVQVPDEVEAVFVKALAIVPAERYQTAGEFWNALRAALRMTPMRSVTTNPEPRLSPGTMRPPGADVAPTALAPPPSVPIVSPRVPPAPISAPGSAPAQKSGAGLFIGLAAVLVLGGAAVGGWYVVTHKGEGPAPSASASSTASAPAAVASARPFGPESCPAGMVFVPGSSYYMGAEDKDADDDEKPPHKVKLSPFCIDRFEVTVEAFKACSDKGECLAASEENSEDPALSPKEKAIYDKACNIRDPIGRAKHPINCVDWHQAANYCKVHGARLPTEAEWELAARGTDGRKYPWGNTPPAVGHFNACGKECVEWGKKNGLQLQGLFKEADGWPNTAIVGSFPEGKSAYGVEDMVGNVYEWVYDWYGEYPKDRDVELVNPTGPASGEKRVVRGGAWNGFSPSMVRPTYRYTGVPGKRSHGYGFRCAFSEAAPK
jgi:formylglycine-generating enzyme required for sulfatase activity/tRNA A-37 threonylcarbamoyl transferase component Bud32